jgi:hypothetical protein
MIFLLIGCSAEQVDSSEISIYEDLRYDWSSMTFTNTDPRDIFYQVGNPYDDFTILHQKIIGESFTTSEMNAYDNLFDILLELSELSNVDIGMIVSYTSSQLKDELQEYSIALTLDHVVTFNLLKTQIEDMEALMNQENYYVSKFEYMEIRLLEDILEDDYLSLEALQDYNTILLDYDSSIRIFELSFEDLLTAYEDIGIIPLEEMIPLLERGHQLIQRIKYS